MPKELGIAAQSLELKQDKGFTFTIEAGNYNDTVMASSAANALQREIDEVITPTVDKYRISKMIAGAGTTLTQSITTDKAYSSFLDASIVLTENIVPASGRIAFVTPDYYKALKLNSNFTGRADKANEIAVNGSIATIDNTAIIVTPSSYFNNADINFVLVHPCATLGPVKLAEYKIMISRRVSADGFVRDVFTLMRSFSKTRRWLLWYQRNRQHKVSFKYIMQQTPS